MNLFSASRAALAAAMAFMLRDQDVPPSKHGTGHRKNVRKTTMCAFGLTDAARRAVILDPALAPVRVVRVRPGVKSKIFRP